MIAAIDLGNTRAKLKFGDEICAVAYEDNWLKRIGEVLPHKKEIFLGLSSVNQAREKELRNFLSDFPQIRLIFIKEIFPPENNILDYTKISGVGIDRLLGVVGARKNSSENIITIDCGTAVTINVAKDSLFLGGAIFAGVKTQLEALEKKSPVLHTKKIPEENIPLFGENTSEALISGIIRGIAGGIEKICSDIEEKIFSHKAVRKIITGGDGKKIFDLLEEENFYFEEHLVIKGIEVVISEKFSTSET